MLMIFTYICLSLWKATHEILSQSDRYPRRIRKIKMSWRSLDKINLILSNSFEIWWCAMWVMLMSNCALVRILMLRFVVRYASMKVNSYAMKFISYLWCIIRCFLCLMIGYEIFLLFGWSLLNLFSSLHFALSMITTCASKPL